MDIVKGQIVCSNAGHDDGQFFIVIDVKDSFVYLADGKERRLDAPKKKNFKHIAKTNTIVEIPKSDKGLRKLLSNFRRVNLED